MIGETINLKKSHLRALAAVAVFLGAGLIGAAPARAGHDGDDGPSVGFHFFFDPPPPPFPFFVFPPPPPPPPAYYYEPAPRAVYMQRPYYRNWRYRARYHEDRDDDRHHEGGHRHRHHHGDDDRDD